MSVPQTEANVCSFDGFLFEPSVPLEGYPSGGLMLLQKHAELGDGFSIEVYGTVGDECRQLMESFGLPLKIFETKLGYSRV